MFVDPTGPDASLSSSPSYQSSSSSSKRPLTSSSDQTRRKESKFETTLEAFSKAMCNNKDKKVLLQMQQAQHAHEENLFEMVMQSIKYLASNMASARCSPGHTPPVPPSQSAPPVQHPHCNPDLNPPQHLDADESPPSLACSRQTKSPKVFDALIIYLYGLFEIFRRRGQSQLTQFEHQLEMRKIRNKRRAVTFASAVIATRPKRTLWMHKRSQDWWDRIIIGTFTDDQWLANLRMRRRTFEFICGKLRPLLHKKSTHLRAAIQPEKRTAVAIWYLASGTDFKTLSELFGIGKSTVSICVWEVCRAIRTLQSQFVSLPQGDRLCEIVEGFKQTWGFPQCGGAIGDTHIPITAPSNNAKDYVNRKGSHSIILQAVVDHLSR